MPPARPSPWSFVLLLCLAGCAPAASQLSGAAVEGALETVEEPSNRERLANIAGDPELQASVEDLSAALARGAVRGIGDPFDPAKVAQSLDRNSAVVARGLTRGVREEIPSTGALIGDAIDGALASATTEQNLARAEMLIASTTDTLIRTMTSSLAVGIEEDLRPVADTASSQASPALARVLGSDAVRDAVGAMLYEASRQTTLGVQDAMAEIAEQDTGILGQLSNIGWWLLAGVLAALFGTSIAVIVLAMKNRRHRDQLVNDTREREQILTTLFSALASKDEALDEGVRKALLRYLRVEPRAASEDAAPMRGQPIDAPA
jgi:hypothetical protein